MRRTIIISIASILSTAALSGCSSGGSGSESSGGGSTPASTSAGAGKYGSPSGSSTASGSSMGAASGSGLATAETSLGTIVVDGKGMTAYYFDKDVKDSGTSACTGDCAAAWPAITSDTAQPEVMGVTGAVGTIPAAGGTMQITIDGRPIYTFAKDKAPGDVTGQGVGGVWYVIAPDGTEMKG